MSEKRFECDNQDVQFSIVEDGELILVNPSYVVNLLNSLQKENEQLKQEVKQYWKYRDVRKQKVKDLEKEKEELGISIKLFEGDVSRLTKEVENLQSNMMESLGKHRKYEKSLEEENKELKQQLDKIPPKIREVWL